MHVVCGVLKKVSGIVDFKNSVHELELGSIHESNYYYFFFKKKDWLRQPKKYIGIVAEHLSFTL